MERFHLVSKAGIIILLFLVLSGSFAHAQQVRMLISGDNALRVFSFMQMNSQAMVAYSDSCMLQGVGQRLVVRAPDWENIMDTVCRDLMDGYSSTCQVFAPPVFSSVHVLGDGIYVLTGYVAHQPVSIKHIWIVSMQKELKVVKRVAMLSMERTDINFSYDPVEKEILVNLRLNGVEEHLIFSFDESLRLTKKGIQVKSRNRNINGGMLRTAGNKEPEAREEVIYSIRF